MLFFQLCSINTVPKSHTDESESWIHDDHEVISQCESPCFVLILITETSVVPPSTHSCLVTASYVEFKCQCPLVFNRFRLTKVLSIVDNSISGDFS